VAEADDGDEIAMLFLSAELAVEETHRSMN
jgi:hypothetical protein